MDNFIVRLKNWAEGNVPDDPSYCAGNDDFATDVMLLLKERNNLRIALRTIAEMPINEQDDMLSANMRKIASGALST